MNLIKNNWNKKEYKDFINYLFSIKEEKYKLFQQKIIPNKNIIGIRTNILKKIAKEIYKGNYQEFINNIENTYYEENILYGLILTNIKDINTLIPYLNKYIKIIDNWASCDLTIYNLKIVKNNKDIFFNYIINNIDNDYTYTKRFCYVLLLNYFIEEKYLNTIFDLSTIKTNDYYVNMSIAWLISICYIKYKKETLEYIKSNKLNSITYNKTIQKIIESKQITNNEKIEFKKLKNLY